MSLSTGTRLGPYEIISPIGAGGMGEVWKARDTRLDRSVAIKILPAEFAENPDLRLRFEREAKTISQLEHPHICRLYDVGEATLGDADVAPRSYLVMELLEGESIADRLTRGPLPLSEVVKYGAQVAEALDRAHRAGVTHRDVKPGNVIITKTGAKLLDFGLAKSAATGVVNLDGATQHKPLTQEGTILGTFQYMAPEQLEGAEADARTDIFALGALLYEMATGRRAFEGKTKTSLIAQIVSADPKPLRDIAPLTPPAFEHVVAKCLSKDPDDRWQSAHDIAEELRWIGEAGSQAGAVPLPKRRPRRELVAWSLVFILAALLGGAAWRFLPTLRKPAQVVRLSVPAPYIIGLFGMTSVAVSPDGQTIVFPVATDGVTRLHVRSLDRFESTPLPGTERGSGPFFSPNGRSIAFFAGGSLKKVSLSGGTAQTICPVSLSARGGTWNTDDTIYFTPSPPSGIWKVRASGGTPVALTTPNAAAGENSHRWPQLLPDAKHVLMTIRTDRITSFDEAKIAVLSLETGKWEVIAEGAAIARYSASGHLVFARAGSLFAQPFDLKTLRPYGSPVSVVSGVVTNPGSGAAHFALGDNGTLVYFSGPILGGSATMSIVDRSGKADRAAPLNRTVFSPRVSPDGTRIALSVAAANDDIWVLELERMALTRVTFESGDEGFPVWSVDGKTIYFAAGSGAGILSRPADGGGTTQQVVSGTGPRQEPGSVSYDGRWLAYTQVNEKSGSDLFLTPLDGRGAPRVFLQTPFEEITPQFSPNGRWIAYVSNESGQQEIYVRSVEPGGGRWQVSTGGGTDPGWSRSGTEVYFQHPQGGLFSAPLGEEVAGLRVGAPKRLFDLPASAAYDIMPDGRFLLVALGLDEGPASAAHVVLNWFDELNKKVPR
ncbi:MAG TPA: protein kinase [Thermoanaerobaculia bacterium]|nr:protein kinase [Thermoanaerobaculia bacterium]